MYRTHTTNTGWQIKHLTTIWSDAHPRNVPESFPILNMQSDFVSGVGCAKPFFSGSASRTILKPRDKNKLDCHSTPHTIETNDSGINPALTQLTKQRALQFVNGNCLPSNETRFVRHSTRKPYSLTHRFCSRTFITFILFRTLTHQSVISVTV